ncbi:MAG TPA: hypothetical protein VK509_25425 [Polyangiales bacterium]|nr:hypothetical protein [Polyangiales bacterium]
MPSAKTAVSVCAIAAASAWAAFGHPDVARAQDARRDRTAEAKAIATTDTAPSPAGKNPSPNPSPNPNDAVAKALLSVLDADPLQLARVAQRFGDAAITPLLKPPTDTALRLAAVRASPWLHAPERALATLAEIAGGRDSELAPAAARAAQQISQQLDPALLARHECLPLDLTPALVALRALGEREHAAPHVRAYAWAAAAQLVAAGVPVPAAK